MEKNTSNIEDDNYFSPKVVWKKFLYYSDDKKTSLYSIIVYENLYFYKTNKIKNEDIHLFTLYSYEELISKSILRYNKIKSTLRPTSYSNYEIIYWEGYLRYKGQNSLIKIHRSTKLNKIFSDIIKSFSINKKSVISLVLVCKYDGTIIFDFSKGTNTCQLLKKLWYEEKFPIHIKMKKKLLTNCFR